MKTFKTKKGTELPLMDVRGRDYLQVAHRLVWFREEHPDWSIETEFVSVNNVEALAKATIKDQIGRVIATGHKSETQKDFPAGHSEKAETGAIGRALALVGYGTQFAPELDEEERLVDAPIAPRAHQKPQAGSHNGMLAEGPYREFVAFVRAAGMDLNYVSEKLSHWYGLNSIRQMTELQVREFEARLNVEWMPKVSPK